MTVLTEPVLSYLHPGTGTPHAARDLSSGGNRQQVLLLRSDPGRDRTHGP